MLFCSSAFTENASRNASVPCASESFSKRGREVSRHDVAFMRGKPRLMALWEGESHLVLGIGGHLRTVIDWYEARKRDEASVAQWEPVADPARPDVPLFIEFTAVFGEEKVAVGCGERVCA